MKRILQYIFLVWVGLVVSCQPAELIDQEQVLFPGEVPYGKATFVVNAVIPDYGPNTKAMGKDAEIDSFHLVVFDENGMFVELAEAEFISDPYQVETPTTGGGTTDGGATDGGATDGGAATVDDGDGEGSSTPTIPTRPNMDSDYVRQFKVVLTLTDKPRIIHFIANCPVDQIAYGHEASIISNLHVDDGETAYWSRAEVPHIMVEDLVYGSDQEIHRHPCEHLIQHLQYVHLLRNFAQIVVTDGTPINDNFELLGFSVYNTIDIGTVAPYNNKNQEFQCFVDWEHDENDELTGSGHTHTYEDLLNDHLYEGHALASAVLNQNLPKNGDNYIWYDEDNPFFMYERKVSVRTDEEEKWRESPPHVIVKANYKESENALPRETYYKFDLVYQVTNETGSSSTVSEIKYYNILRNFLYDFSITSVSGPGYDSPEAAMAGVASNNLAGSTTTSKFTEVALDDGEIAVSYTDTTLVNGGTINFKYKYTRETDGTKTVLNDSPAVTLVNSTGDVISSCVIATNDITTSGTWQGYREVTLTIKDPVNTTLEQILIVKTENPMLSRNVRFTLKKKLDMQVECLPRIFRGVAVDQKIKIKLPKGLTEDMFPLTLAIEVKGLTLSPDASENSIPVQTGKSIVPGRESQNSFYYTYTINTFEEYDKPAAGGKIVKEEDGTRVITTDWITNRIDNASTVYVANKYFNTASDSWTNVAYKFQGASVNQTSIPKGLDRDVSISFTMDSGDGNWGSRSVTVNLDSLKTSDGASSLTFALNNLPTGVTVNNNTRTVTVPGLKTTGKTGKVGFSLDCADYMLASDYQDNRVNNSFDGKFDKNSVAAEAGIAVNYTFKIPQYYSGMKVNVTLDGLVPQSTETRLKLVGTTGSIRKYEFTPTQGTTEYVLALQTANKIASICMLSLETSADCYYEPVTSELNQAMREFVSLTVPAVRQGVGRPVNISFVMPNDDTNYANKTIRVSLVGMKRKNSTTTGENESFTINTSDGDAVSINGRTITLKNIVTTTTAGNLSVTISADDYQAKNVTVTNRAKSQFTTMTLDPTSVGPNAGEVVTLSFSSDGLYDGMPVTLELDGLEPVNSSVATRAATSYAYTVSGTGTQTVQLRTTEATTSSKTCTVQLKADGFDDSAVKTVEQSTAKYKFNASIEGNPTSINANTVVKLKFNIPQEAFNDGIRTIRITLDGLVPSGNNNQLKQINGTNVYEYTVNNQGDKTINLKPSEDVDRTCSATLQATNFKTETVSVTQKITHALKASNSTTNTADYDSQAVYQFANNTTLTNGWSYTLVFWVKADKTISNNNFSIFLKKSSNDNYQHQQTLNIEDDITTDWTKKEITFSASQSDFNRVAFNIGLVGTDNAIYFDKVSLVRNGQEFIVNGDFEENISNFVSNEVNPQKPTPDTWWVKVNEGRNPIPQCTLQIVQPGCTKE